MSTRLEEIVAKLHVINFGEDGIICPSKVYNGQKRAEKYCFNDLKDNIIGDLPSHYYSGGCRLCDKCSEFADKLLYNDTNEHEGKGYSLAAITHGSHTIDFLTAHGKSQKDVQGWSQKPVLFVMENPGEATDSYAKIESDKRCPCKAWYWINNQGNKGDDEFVYPKFFVQKEYGWMIYSAIKTFRLANAYLTNMVKCGIGGDGGKKYLTTDYYNTDIVNKCIEERLEKELEVLRGGDNDQLVPVFAFGKRTYDKLRESLQGKNCKVYLLPHPASRIPNEFRKHTLLCGIMRGLCQCGVYDGVAERPNLEEILLRDGI